MPPPARAAPPSTYSTVAVVAALRPSASIGATGACQAHGIALVHMRLTSSADDDALTPNAIAVTRSATPAPPVTRPAMRLLLPVSSEISAGALGPPSARNGCVLGASWGGGRGESPPFCLAAIRGSALRRS